MDERLTLIQPDDSDIPVLTKLDHESMTPDDLATLSYPDSVQRFFDYISKKAHDELSRQASCVVLAGDAIVAFCLFIAERDGEAHLYNIHVAESHRRKGIATQMIQRGITILADQYSRVNLEGVERGEPSHLLYKKLGFEERNEYS